MRSGQAEVLHQRGASPVRIGVEMVAIPEGGEVDVEAHVQPLGDAVMVDATVRAVLDGECARCLSPLHPEAEIHVNEVFATSAEFVQGEADDDEDAEATPLIKDDEVDLLQQVIDEAGVRLPFNPTCEDGTCEGDVPAPDEPQVDSRWAGLEKFL